MQVGIRLRYESSTWLVYSGMKLFMVPS